MKQIIEQFLTFLFLFMFILIGFSYVIQNVTYTSARDYYSFVIHQIEDNDYEEAIIADMIKNANKMGFELDVEQYKNIKGERKARIRMEYKYTVPIAGVELEENLSTAMKQTMKEVMENKETARWERDEMVSSFLQLLISKMSGEINLIIKIIQADIEHGILDVELTGIFSISGNQSREIVVRRKVTFTNHLYSS